MKEKGKKSSEEIDLVLQLNT